MPLAPPVTTTTLSRRAIRSRPPSRLGDAKGQTSTRCCSLSVEALKPFLTEDELRGGGDHSVDLLERRRRHSRLPGRISKLQPIPGRVKEVDLAAVEDRVAPIDDRSGERHVLLVKQPNRLFPP